MLGLYGSQIKWSVLLTFVWMIFLSQNPFWSLRPDLHDHISNVHSTILFWNRGLDIYFKPIRELLPVDQSKNGVQFAKNWGWPESEMFVLPERKVNEPLMIVWAHMPRPYPPGLYIILSPITFLMEVMGGFSNIFLGILTCFFCLLGHFSFFQFYNAVNRTFRLPPMKWLFNFIIFSIYFEFIGWSTSGQYDAMGLLFLIPSLLSIEENKFLRSIILFCFSFSIHFRAVLWVFPLLTVWAINLQTLKREYLNLSLLKKIGTLLVLFLTCFSFGVFLVVSKSLINSINSNYFVLDLLIGNWNEKQWVFILSIFFICLFLFLSRSYLVLVGVFEILLLFFNSKFLQPWYSLFLYPLLTAFKANADNRWDFYLRSYTLIIISYSFLNSSPTEFYFFKKIVHSLI